MRQGVGRAGGEGYCSEVTNALLLSMDSSITPQAISIDGCLYVRADSAVSGNRAIVVIDRGFIYAGNVTRANGRMRLDQCVWVFGWDSCGFAAVIDDPKKADIRKHAAIELPERSEIFSVPVHDQWGLE